jgi:hypothetical protein
VRCQAPVSGYAENEDSLRTEEENMADPMLAQDETTLDDNAVLLPTGWAEAIVARDGEDEPNVLRGLE